MGSLGVSILVTMILMSVLMLTIIDCSEAEFSITPSLLLEGISQYDTPNSYVSEKLTVFETGKYQVTNPIMVEKSHQYSNPEPLLIISPKEEGSYPVLFFIHGFVISNQEYSDLLKHVASHGFIVVAPLLFRPWIRAPSQAEEIEKAATMLNWLPVKLHEVLYDHVSAKVSADLQKVAISGHSRGGKSAFAVALGMSKTKLNLNASALIGVDPVSGRDNHMQTEPQVLTYIDNSFDLSIPVTVIGTGLGSKPNFLIIPPCAPSNVSHQEFFNECKQGSHFVIEKYGHMQMLNDFIIDPAVVTMSAMCTYGLGPKTTMRRTLGGIMVAFLDAYFKDEIQQYLALLANQSQAPTTLSVRTKDNFGSAPTTYAQQV